MCDSQLLTGAESQIIEVTNKYIMGNWFDIDFSELKSYVTWSKELLSKLFIKF